MRVSLEDLEASCLQCQRCDLAKERKHVVVSRGHPSARLMVIGEAPGAEEDAQGRAARPRRAFDDAAVIAGTVTGSVTEAGGVTLQSETGPALPSPIPG